MSHAALTLPLEQRVDYLIAVASVAYADGEVAESEIITLRTLAEALELDAAGVERVIAAARAPDLARVDAIVSGFRKQPLAYSLLTDAVILCYADGKVAPGETKEIAEFADALGLTTSQAVLIGRYVESVLVDAEQGSLSKALADGLAEAASHVHPPRGVKWLYRKLSGH